MVTEDVSKYTRAAVFQPGAKSEVLQRNSSVVGEQGSPDTWRDVRGFALRFYMSKGSYDIVGNNTPVSFIRDAIKFPDFIHSQKRLDGPLGDPECAGEGGWQWMLASELGYVLSSARRASSALPPRSRAGPLALTVCRGDLRRWGVPPFLLQFFERLARCHDLIASSHAVELAH